MEGRERVKKEEEGTRAGRRGRVVVVMLRDRVVKRAKEGGKISRLDRTELPEEGYRRW